MGRSGRLASLLNGQSVNPPLALENESPAIKWGFRFLAKGLNQYLCYEFQSYDW